MRSSTGSPGRADETTLIGDLTSDDLGFFIAYISDLRTTEQELFNTFSRAMTTAKDPEWRHFRGLKEDSQDRLKFLRDTLSWLLDVRREREEDKRRWQDWKLE